MSEIMRNHKLLDNARKLRREMTPQEKHLWYDYLRYYPVKIYKQRIIDSFIVDFYCAKARLVIELDGSQHYTPDGKHYDGLRTDVIEKYKNDKFCTFKFTVSAMHDLITLNCLCNRKAWYKSIRKDLPVFLVKYRN